MARKVAIITSLCSAFGSYFYIKSDYANQKQAYAEEAEKKFILERVQVIFRHGARAPIAPLDCIPDFYYGPKIMEHPLNTFCPYKLLDSRGRAFSESGMRGSSHSFFGQLTGKGAQQLNALGKVIRDTYMSAKRGAFLPYEFNPIQVYVSSTKMKRTVESARSLLSGMYPDQTTEIPINLHEIPDDEILSPSFKMCHFLKNVSAYSWDNTDTISGLKLIRQGLQKLLGVADDDKTFHVVLLRDALYSHKFHDVLPQQLNNPILLKVVEEGALRVMNHVFCGKGGDQSEKILRLSVGRLVHLLVHNLEEFGHMDVKMKKNKAKLFLYSSHDTTLIPLLNVLGIYDGKWPPFAAHLIIELYRDDSEYDTCMCSKSLNGYYVKVLYNGVPQRLFKNEEFMIPFPVFKNAIKKYSLRQSDYDAECMPPPNQPPPTPIPSPKPCPANPRCTKYKTKDCV